MFFHEGELGKLRVDYRGATSRNVMLFDCNFKLNLCSFESVAISNAKKKTYGDFLFDTEDTPKYAANVLGGAVSKKYRQQHYYDTPQYVAHVWRGSVSKNNRRLPKTEITNRAWTPVLTINTLGL